MPGAYWGQRRLPRQRKFVGVTPLEYCHGDVIGAISDSPGGAMNMAGRFRSDDGGGNRALRRCCRSPTMSIVTLVVRILAHWLLDDAALRLGVVGATMLPFCTRGAPCMPQVRPGFRARIAPAGDGTVSVSWPIRRGSGVVGTGIGHAFGVVSAVVGGRRAVGRGVGDGVVASGVAHATSAPASWSGVGVFQDGVSYVAFAAIELLVALQSWLGDPDDRPLVSSC